MNGVVFVVGSVNVDSVVRVESFPQPGETVFGGEHHISLGGKGANQAVAAHLFGATVRLHAYVGSDSEGSFVRGEISRLGLGASDLTDVAGTPTGFASIIVDTSGENQIVVSSGANEHYSPGRLAAVDARDIVLAQGEVAAHAIIEAGERAQAAGARFVLNLAPPRSLPRPLVALADPLVVNEHEARQLGIDPLDLAGTVGTVARSIVVTRGALGAVVADDHGVTVIPAPSITAVDTTGAGDAFVGALVAVLALGGCLEEAARTAVVAGAYSAQRQGTIASYGIAADVQALRDLGDK